MGYNYEYEFFEPSIGEGLAIGAAGVAVAFVVIFVLLMLAFAIVSYVLSSVGLYRIAKRRGIHHPWLAWIPVGNGWLLGSISDHYQYVAKQKVTKHRKVMLTLQIISCAFGFVYGLFTALTAIAGNSAGSAIGMIAVMVIAYLAALGISIAYTVFCYISYYDLFQSCKPGTAVVFLVLGIVFTVTLPFFVFACSSSDKGMPARRVDRPAAQIPYEPAPAAEPVQEQIRVVEAVPVEEVPAEESEE